MKTVKLKICRERKSQLIVSCQVVTNPWCGLAVIFCGFISLLIGRETINIPEIFSGVHGFMGKTVISSIYLGCLKDTGVEFQRNLKFIEDYQHASEGSFVFTRSPGPSLVTEALPLAIPPFLLFLLFLVIINTLPKKSI